MTGSQVTKYYFAGAQRVAMRSGSTLTYLLSDHLGSTSLTTNTSGALISELRYKPWGETRYASGTTPTNYKYTGQREESSFGLYFYNARWYDSLTGRFAQADTIVPGMGNSQAWDRYSYVLNNPVRYNDPSGHVCSDPEDENGGCEGDGGTLSKDYAANFYRSSLKDRYDWNIADDFSEDELKVIRQTAYNIESYVDGLTGGMGQEWMNAYLGGTTITRWDGGYYRTLPSWMVGENTIYISPGAVSGGTFAHELGHIWDINTSSKTTCLCGVVGGVADQLNNVIGGNEFLRELHYSWMNDNDQTPNFTIPETVTYNGVAFQNWFTIGGGYGNNGTADYLAEAFRWNIYNHNNVPVLARAWVDAMITAQASTLP